MDVHRFFRHVFTTRAAVGRRFPPAALQAIENAIDRSERSHLGEIRFAVEPALDPGQLFAGMTPRERAIEVFSALRVWDTEANSGVLVYLLYADHAIEIVADRGIHVRAGAQAWERIAADMEEAFLAGDYEAGVLRGIAAISAQLQHHLPSADGGGDELPDGVALL